MPSKNPGGEDVAAEQLMRPGRRRRILIGASVALLLAGLGAAAAYALSVHSTQAAQQRTTSITAKQKGTGQTVTERQTSQQKTASHTTTGSGSGHHHGNKTKTTQSVGPSSRGSTVTTHVVTTGSHHHKSSKPVTIADGFDAGYIKPRTWGDKVTEGNDVSLLEQGGQLQLTVGADAVPGGHQDQIDVHVATQCAFPGDFDARVSYTLPVWPAGDNIDVGMYANADSAVMRDNSSQSGDGYTSWVGQSNGSVPFTALGGSLRIARVAGIETTYFWHGGRWRKLARFRELGQAVIGLQAVSDGQNPFGGQELKVAFDNFKVTGAKPVCS